MCDEMWMCLSVDEVEGPVKGAGTYFKTRLFVLVKAHCDSSSTGNLSWTQPSSKTGGSSSYTHTPLPGGPGASRARLLHRMSSQHRTEWSHAFFYVNLLFSSAPHTPHPPSECLSFSSCPFAPQKNRRSAARLPGKRKATPLSPCLLLCQLYLNKYELKWTLILKTAAWL